MEQVFKVIIRDTEAAAVEIVPIDGGVEVVVRKDSKVLAPKDEPKAAKSATCKNADILKDFCSKKKIEFVGYTLMRKELLKFYNFYNARVCEWKGVIQPEKLWKSWEEKINDKGALKK